MPKRTDTYSAFVRETCQNCGPTAANMRDHMIIGAALEMMAEAGEVLEIIQKASRKYAGRFNDEDISNLVDEAGDVLWGLTALCNALGVSLDDLMDYNQKKLEARRAAK